MSTNRVTVSSPSPGLNSGARRFRNHGDYPLRFELDPITPTQWAILHEAPDRPSGVRLRAAMIDLAWRDLFLSVGSPTDYARYIYASAWYWFTSAPGLRWPVSVRECCDTVGIDHRKVANAVLTHPQLHPPTLSVRDMMRGERLREASVRDKKPRVARMGRDAKLRAALTALHQLGGDACAKAIEERLGYGSARMWAQVLREHANRPAQCCVGWGVEKPRRDPYAKPGRWDRMQHYTLVGPGHCCGWEPPAEPTDA